MIDLIDSHSSAGMLVVDTAPNPVAIIGRDQAALKGLLFYFTGKPCIRKHIASRRVDTCQCTRCRAEDIKKFNSLRDRRSK